MINTSFHHYFRHYGQFSGSVSYCITTYSTSLASRRLNTFWEIEHYDFAECLSAALVAAAPRPLPTPQCHTQIPSPSLANTSKSRQCWPACFLIGSYHGLATFYLSAASQLKETLRLHWRYGWWSSMIIRDDIDWCIAISKKRLSIILGSSLA